MTRQNGFTILEVMMVVAGLAILASITVFAINPARQLQRTRNYERLVNVNVILNAVYHYSSDGDGTLPSGIPVASSCLSASGHEICRTDAVSCTGFVSLDMLTDDLRYLVEMPTDPDLASASNGTGYGVIRTAAGRLAVCALLAEDDEIVQVVR